MFEITENTSKVNTNFFVEHSDNVNKIANITNEEMPWLLGELQDGWEWFAFTFNDQPQISLSIDEIENIAKFIASVDKNIPLHLSRYFPRYNLNNPPTDIESIIKARDIAKRYLNYVYIAKNG